MKRIIAILFILFLCAVLFTGCTKGGLIGKWKEVNLGSTFEFKQNGDLIIGEQTWGYRLEGTYLVLSRGEKEMYCNYQKQGNSMTITDENGIFTFHLEKAED